MTAVRRRRPRPQPRSAPARAAPTPVVSPVPREAPPTARRPRTDPRSLAAAAAQSALLPVDPRSPSGYVVEGPALAEGEIPAFRTSFFANIRELRAQALGVEQSRALAPRALEAVRGYQREDLMAVAEIAYHYLFNGGAELARVLYEGLTAVAPDEPYFALALALTHDHLGSVDSAFHWYQKASELDPRDARPDINRAELYLQQRDLRRARPLLREGHTKAEARHETELAAKAAALLRHLDRAEAKGAPVRRQVPQRVRPAVGPGRPAASR